MNRILSFDVGIKNLSYCLADVPNVDNIDNVGKSIKNIIIQKWENVKITDKKCNTIHLHESARCMLDTLKNEFPPDILDKIDIILIENQPGHMNKTMKSLSMIMYTFFMMHDKYVKFVSPFYKLKCIKCQELLKTNNYNIKKYYDRKKLSVDTVKFYVNEYFNTFEEIFKKEKKKDDLSDSMLYIIYYFENMR